MTPADLEAIRKSVGDAECVSGFVRYTDAKALLQHIAELEQKVNALDTHVAAQGKEILHFVRETGDLRAQVGEILK